MAERNQPPANRAGRRRRRKRKAEALSGILRTQILTLPNGARLPSVRSLMTRYQLSLTTIKATLEKLEAEGLIVRRHGSGIYISEERAVKLIKLHRSRFSSYFEDAKEASIRAALRRAGWHLVVRRHESLDRLEHEPLFTEGVASAHLVSQDLANLRPDLLEQLAGQDVPVVVLGRQMNTRRFDCLLSDHRKILNLLVRHLRDLGHRKIALLINEPRVYEEIQARVRLFKEIVAERGLPAATLIDCRTSPGEHSAHAALRGLSEYLDQHGARPLPFTAIVAASSCGGQGALKALYDRGISVPKECSVTTFGYEAENSLMVPALTDAGTPIPLWGEWALNLLEQRLSGEAGPGLRMIMPATLSDRESTAPAPASSSSKKRKPQASRNLPGSGRRARKPA